MAMAHYSAYDRPLYADAALQWPHPAYPAPDPDYLAPAYQWDSDRISWSTPPAPPFPPDTASEYAHSDGSSQLSYPPDFPDPAPRAAFPHTRAARSPYPLVPSRPERPRFEQAIWRETELYVIDDPEDPAPPCEPAPRVKEEQREDSFVFEQPAPGFGNSAAATAHHPGTEVPLRATQATPKMRSLMGVFRLNPFAVHNGVRHSASNLSWLGEEIGPLAEEPQLIEFQIMLLVPLIDDDDDPADSRPAPAPPRPSPTPSRYSSVPDERWSIPAQEHQQQQHQQQHRHHHPPQHHQPQHPSPSDVFSPLMTPAQSLNWSMHTAGSAPEFLGAYSSSAPAPAPHTLPAHRPQSHGFGAFGRDPAAAGFRASSSLSGVTHAASFLRSEHDAYADPWTRRAEQQYASAAQARGEDGYAHADPFARPGSPGTRRHLHALGERAPRYV